MSYNKIIIAGNIGKDCETRVVGTKNCISFSVAVSDRYKKDGQTVEKTTWFDCDYFTDSIGIAEYLKKGQPVILDGSMESRQYEKDGQKRTAWSVRVISVRLFGSRREDAAPSAPAVQEPAPEPQPAKPLKELFPNAPRATQEGLDALMSKFIDDLPF